MKIRLLFKITFFVFLILSFFSPTTYAMAAKDGFVAVRTIESRYFTILVEDGVNIQKLAMILSVPPSIRTIVRDPIPYATSYELKDQLDIFFLAVSEIMDVRLKDFKCKIKICKDASSLSAVAGSLFGIDLTPGGFYVVAVDTLYIDAENVNLNILGHELSHAIQCYYFTVPPPERLQEVLAGFVEYQLRKSTGSLP